MVSFMGDTTQENVQIPHQTSVKKMKQLNLAITPKKQDSSDNETIVL
tara:strand:- start:783 stop:923 length:141 start_codon:yes stop_codon:yes gene_type:complete